MSPKANKSEKVQPQAQQPQFVSQETMVHGQGMINTLAAQRNAALDACAQLQGTIDVLNVQKAALEKELKDTKEELAKYLTPTP
jgi:hypothetical protein